MKPIKSLAAVALLAGIVSQTPVFGLTLTQSLSAPAPSGYTLAQTSQSSVNPSTAHTSTANSASARGAGETFQVFSPNQTGSGYFDAAELTAITVDNTTNGTIGSQTYRLTVSTVSGTDGNFAGGNISTVVDTETVTQALTGTTGGYLTFSLSNYVTLTAGTVYLFNLTTTTTALTLASNGSPGLGNYVGLPVGTTSGQAGNYERASSFNSTNAVSNGTGALEFYLDTVPVPEPVNWALVPVLGTMAFFAFRRFSNQSAV